MVGTSNKSDPESWPLILSSPGFHHHFRTVDRGMIRTIPSQALQGNDQGWYRWTNQRGLLRTKKERGTSVPESELEKAYHTSLQKFGFFDGIGVYIYISIYPAKSVDVNDE